MADTTGVVIDPRYEAHDTGGGHPERPERIKVLLPLMEANAERIVAVAARPASGDELALVHDGAYVEEVAATAQRAAVVCVRCRYARRVRNRTTRRAWPPAACWRCSMP